MKRYFLVVLIAISLVLTSVVACSSGVNQSQYDKLYDEVNVLRGKKAEASMYALFLDILMYQFYQQANIQTRYKFATYDEWTKSLTRTAESMNDTKLKSLLDKMIKDPETPETFMELANYVIGRISATLQS